MLEFVVSVSVLVLLALLFIVPPLLKKPDIDIEQDESFDEQNIRIAKERMAELKQDLENDRISQDVFDKAIEELEKNLALDLSISEQKKSSQNTARPSKMTAIFLIAIVPIAAVLIYLQLGNYQSIEAGSGRLADKKIGAPGGPQMTMEEAVNKLRARLEAQPENPQGWFMLARSYAALERYGEAADAYKKTIELAGEDADLLLRYADTMIMRDGGQFTPEAVELIHKSLSLDPEHPQALWLAGTAASLNGDIKQALSYWYKLDPMLNQNIGAQTELRGMIKKAEQKLNGDEVAELKKQIKPAQKASAGASIQVSVSLDDALKDKVSPTDTVFIFAKALQGPPMPLAAVKQTVAALPLQLTLSDAMAMMPNMKLSSFKQVKISAVISKSGRPGLSPGDFYGEQSPVDVQKTSSISIVINKVK